MSMILDGSNGITMPTWTTANRPTNPIIGAQGYNTTYGGVEVYNGSAWDLITGGPAFSAYTSAGNTTLTANTNTKIKFDAKDFDTANCFDNVTNNRFQPTVPGYYQVSTAVQYGGSPSSPTSMTTGIWKNGSVWKRMYLSATLYGQATPLSGLIYLNGTTDYVEIYAYIACSGGTPVANAGLEVTWFQGTFVRGQ